MNSIFREKRIYQEELEAETKPSSNENFNIVTHDNGFPRARLYSLSCKLYFTEYKGLTIKELIETDFDFFTWLPRKIKNFYYDEKVLKYASESLELLEEIDKYPHNNSPSLKTAIHQVKTMTDYEFCLDFEEDEFQLLELKSLINVPFYKTIINTPIEGLIRQALNIYQVSSDYRRKHFEEMALILNKK